jgi:hypothetical protein
MDRPVQQFTITPAQYQEMIVKSQAAGIPVVGDSGTASKFGIGVSWHYIEPTLSIQVVSTPFFVKPETIEAQIAEQVAAIQKG